MNDRSYYLIARLLNLFYWRGTLLGGEYLPALGPAVIAANHLGPLGPIGTVCSIPLRLHPWIIADMVDPQKAADYLRKDFVEPSLRLKPPTSMRVAQGLSRLSVPLLISIGCIPVVRGDVQELSITLAALQEGKVVLIFPEDPELELDAETQMRPFMKGFTRLGELFYAQTGELLRFYPLAVHASRRVQVGQPVFFDPQNPLGVERLRLMHTLESQIREMYLGLGR